MVRRKGLLCEHKDRSKIDVPQFPRLIVEVCNSCGDMYCVFVEDSKGVSQQVWRTHY